MKNLLVKIIGMYFNLLAHLAPRFAGRRGFYLFSSPRRGSIQEHHHAFLASATKFTFECDGNRLQAYRWGTGKKVVLFLHGWQSQTFRWKKYIEALTPDEFTMYAFDAPGHGFSQGRYLNLPIYSNAIEEFIRQVEPIHTIVGHSLGSFAVLHSWYRLNGLPVKQLVILGTPGEARDFVRDYQNALGLSSRAIRAIRNGFKEIARHLPEYYSAPKFAMAMNIPGLIIHDLHDKEAPHQYALEINKSWKNSRLVSTQGLGHNLRSQVVVQEVVDFIRERTSPVISMDEFTATLHMN